MQARNHDTRFDGIHKTKLQAFVASRPKILQSQITARPENRLQLNSLGDFHGRRANGAPERAPDDRLRDVRGDLDDNSRISLRSCGYSLSNTHLPPMAKAPGEKHEKLSGSRRCSPHWNRAPPSIRPSPRLHILRLGWGRFGAEFRNAEVTRADAIASG